MPLLTNLVNEGKENDGLVAVLEDVKRDLGEIGGTGREEGYLSLCVSMGLQGALVGALTCVDSGGRVGVSAR